jgi:hypothetical protein
LEHREPNEYNLGDSLLTKNNRGGIYILYNGDRVYYVGMSKKSISKRLRDHLKDRHKGKWNFFSFYQIKHDKEKYMKDVESLLNRICRARGNRTKGSFKKRYDLSKRVD